MIVADGLWSHSAILLFPLQQGSKDANVGEQEMRGEGLEDSGNGKERMKTQLFLHVILWRIKDLVSCFQDGGIYLIFVFTIY